MILGLRESAAEEKIKDAHRRIMIANHPDSGGKCRLDGVSDWTYKATSGRTVIAAMQNLVGEAHLVVRLVWCTDLKAEVQRRIVACS